MSNSPMNRRSFVCGSALGLAGIAAGAAGVGSALAADGKASSPADGAAAAGKAGAVSSKADAASSAKGTSTADVPAWLGAEPEVAASDIIATDACDLLIVGAGCAGMAAAATASDLGLNFILVDRAQVVPETREYLGAVNSADVKAAGCEVNPGKILNEISRYSSGKCNRDLVRMWVEDSSEMIDWLDPIMAGAGKAPEVDTTVATAHEDGGTDYYLPVVQHCWPVPYEPPTRNDVLLSHIQDAGYDCRFGYDLVRLVHEQGKVSGAIFQTEAGYVQIDAAYTLLATGGYPANPEMMEALQPDAVQVMTANSYNSFDEGDGIKAAMWAGARKQADPAPMLFDRGAVLPGVDAGYVEGADGKKELPGEIYQLNIGSQPFLKVNRRGKRFANESTPYDNMLFATRRQPGGVFCQVFDGNAPEDIKRFMMIGCASYTRMMMEQGMSIEDFMQVDGGTEVMMKADTLDELADKLGFEGEDKEAFLATCDRYNELYDAQEDSDYGKEAYRLSELRTPPFYGCWFGASLLTTLDGIEINDRMQALDADWQPIPGLYAAGDCSGSFFATNYPEYIPGLAAGRSVTEGRRAVMGIASDPDFVATDPTPSNVPSVDVDTSKLADGTYTGTGSGMGGDINVTIEVKGGKISVTDISPNNETPGIGGKEAIDDGTFAQQIEAAQGADIDGVSGASVTSAAIKQAVKEALRKAAE
ncbi:MAG: FAD-binding protein [Coriobacteriales bacterium]|jgi:fumarate reductase flavoprotein subunit